jgi:ABC-type transport system involved in Fe-S cluster assembly fused permease/ATPase subunit
MESVTSPEPGESAPAFRSSSTTAILIATQNWYSVALLGTFLCVSAATSIRNAKQTIALKKGKDRKNADLKGAAAAAAAAADDAKQTADDQADKSVFGPRFRSLGRFYFMLCTATIVLSIVASWVALSAHAFGDGQPKKWIKTGSWWWTDRSLIVYLVGALHMHSWLVVSLFRGKDAPSVAHISTWLVALVGELVLLLGTYWRAASCHHLDPDVPADSQQCVGHWDRIDIGLYAVRSMTLFGMCFVYCLAWAATAASRRDNAVPLEVDEATPLLAGGAHKSYQTHHAREHHDPQDSDSEREDHSADTSDNEHDDYEDTIRRHSRPVETAKPTKEEQDAFYRPRKLPRKNWWEYFRGYSVFFPYLWPSDSRPLQCAVVACFAMVMCERVVNMVVPIQVGQVTQRLLESRGTNWYEAITSGAFPLAQLVLLGVYWSLQGSGGLISSARSLLWIRVSQHSYRALATAAFEHVHSLSLDFHLGKRTGEVLSALNKGASINTFLEQVTFNVVPMLVDLIFAIYFFWFFFGSVFAILIGTNTFWYLYVTVQMAQTRAEQRRDMTNADREEEAVKNDSITCYETVKYFNAERFEFRRYRDAIDTFQAAEAQVSIGNNRMTIIQALVYNGGRLLAAILGAWKVSTGMMTVGQYTTLLAYLAQLQSPLNFFGTFYRSVQAAMISGERLLSLFEQQPTVVDSPTAKTLEVCRGSIKWRNVSFAYNNRRTALDNIDLECAPGTTTAFVGASGGGKSTIFRLMFRYYNASGGSIEIDGHDVRDLTIDSVRRHIGVVPQDTTLFNETIMYNLKYANPSASDEEVYSACKAASIHDTIMKFPDGYQSKVGERGQKLSGGERQRVAIARTILKNPQIIMLDEATSALDTNTEQQIQDKLGNVGAGRTILIIAHRLSTITDADQIVVLDNGMIAEKGSHNELLAKDGKYAAMWATQSKAENAAKQAHRATRHAKKLLRSANMHGTEVTDAASDGYNSMASSMILRASPHDIASRDVSPPSSSDSSDAGSIHNQPRE